MDDVDPIKSGAGDRLNEAGQALVTLLGRLAADGYEFVTPTPVTHRQKLRRSGFRRARDLRDVFGWSLPFLRKDLDPEIFDLMARGGAIGRRGFSFASRVRVASLGGRLFLHSAFPPSAPDAVFFGPDSYRFASFIRAEFQPLAPGARVADIGAGSGVGGIAVMDLAPGAELVLTDINPRALDLARINVAFAGLQAARCVHTSGLADVPGPFDLIVCNPPFIAGKGGRIYRDGGAMRGAEVTLDWAKSAADRLAPGGRLLMYTGSAIVDGRDPLREALAETFAVQGCSFAYREIDPDIFPETLIGPAYWDVDRIAAVGAVAVKA